MKIQNKFIKLRFPHISIFCFISLVFIAGCKKFVEVPLPVSTISGDAAFITDQSSAAVLNNIYGSLSSSGTFDSYQGIGIYSGLYTDELTPALSNQVMTAFYSDAVQSGNTSIYWTRLYQQIATTNVAIEQIPVQAKLTHKNQWLGEAYFLRAFMYSYLVNLYGDVPLAITSDYKVTNVLARAPKSDVYKQIIADLKQAQSLLTDEYMDTRGSTTTDRGRPSKLAATALLARTYLYTTDYADAEAQASVLISNPNLKLTALSQTFLANSAETIWALAIEPTNLYPYEQDYGAYNDGTPAIIPAGKKLSTYVYVSLSPQMISAFEPGDQRFTTWSRPVITTDEPVTTYNLVNKYQSAVNGVEYIMIFRQAEQYLIRAEARAMQNNLNGAKADLDAVRTRAGLGGVTVSTQANMLAAVLHERQVEMFTELGARLFDLRRSGTIDAVMGAVAPSKGSSWQSFMQLWPISSQDILTDPNLKQTPGYNN